MSRITDCFNTLRKNKKKALIPFITAGDPDPGTTVSLLRTLAENGADIIELGIPFSDPMADGPVIQRSSERALRHGVSLSNVLDMVTEFRQSDTATPIILMGYLNPVEIMGYATFAESARNAGVDGVLLVDLPPEEADEFQAELSRNGLDQVFLLSPTTSDERLAVICSKASGFLYYVSLKGVTGSNRLDVGEVSDKIRHIRSLSQLPVGVGFGIKDEQTAREVAAFSDAVIIGSALVERIGNCGGEREKLLQDVGSFLSGLRTAMDAA